MIADGRVCVGSQVVLRADFKANAADITLDSQPLEAPDGLLVMLHKPLGYVCSHDSAEGSTIYELLPDRWLARNPVISSIGRLDKDTSGLILITDQGQLSHRLTSPKHHVTKTYEVTVDRSLENPLIELFASGTLLLRNETKPCAPAELEILSPTFARLHLNEGRYHQVRRMFASQGYHVEQLHRSRFGPYELGDLEQGEWRHLPLPG